MAELQPLGCAANAKNLTLQTPVNLAFEVLVHGCVPQKRLQSCATVVHALHYAMGMRLLACAWSPLYSQLAQSALDGHNAP